MTPPILFLIFNRPDLTKITFASIRAAKPKQLFIAADGPREDRDGEAEACELARQITNEVNWDCEVKTLFRAENLGCEGAVSTAISWFFDHVEQGIILEDDCVADPSFFQFCDEMLTKYADDQRIGVVTGDNFQQGNQHGDASYYFSKYPHCWGWATWRRCWKHYQRDLYKDPNEIAETVSNFSPVKGELDYWQTIFENTQARRVDSWAFRWTYAQWKQKLLTVTPQKNLVENIGIGPEATHTTSSDMDLPNLAALQFPLVHPDTVAHNLEADAFVARNTFQVDRHVKPKVKPPKLSRRLRQFGKDLVSRLVSASK